MTFFEAIILGAVQGLTEFLPISSSGHLVLFQNLLGLESSSIAFEVFVHLGTLLSIVAIYYNDLGKIIGSFFSGLASGRVRARYADDHYFRLGIFLIIGTIPAVFAGLFCKDFIESIFHNIHLVGITLIITGIILALTHLKKIGRRSLGPANSLVIGLAQMLAILPGISRSGTTISTGLFLGIPRDEAARFSFLLAVPAILGAAILESADLFSGGLQFSWHLLAIGLIVSFIVGFLAIRFLLKVLRSGKFALFAPYCFIAGLIILLVLK